MGIKVLLVARVFPPRPGGIENYVYELHRRLPPGFDTTVLTPRTGADGEFDRQSRLRIRRIPYLGARFKLSYIPVWIAGALAALIYRPDVVVFDQLDTALIAPLLRALRVPYVIFVYAAELNEPFARRARRFVVRHAASLIGVSQFSTDRLLEYANADPKRVTVIHPGTDLEWLSAGDASQVRRRYCLGECPVVLSVARMSERERYKNQDVLIEAFRAVLDDVPECRLVIVGDGPDRQRLEQTAANVMVKDRVIFTGRVSKDELADLYAAADVFALPAGRNESGMTEGFGIVFIEAAAAATPVVYSPVGGVREAVEDGVTGIAVQHDDRTAVARAIVRLLTDGEFAATMGELGRQRVMGRFTWDHASQLYAGILARVGSVG